MTKETQQARRAAFEADFKIRRKSTFPEIELSRDSGDGYKYNPAQSDWEAWNAALDSIMIELPADRSLSASDDPWYVVEQCRHAIRAAGVKTR